MSAPRIQCARLGWIAANQITISKIMPTIAIPAQSSCFFASLRFPWSSAVARRNAIQRATPTAMTPTIANNDIAMFWMSETVVVTAPGVALASSSPNKFPITFSSYVFLVICVKGCFCEQLRRGGVGENGGKMGFGVGLWFGKLKKCKKSVDIKIEIVNN